MVSPSLMDSVGHVGAHAPQEMHSSVIFMAMVISPLDFAGFCRCPMNVGRQPPHSDYHIGARRSNDKYHGF
jgi:hypothetical protein